MTTLYAALAAAFWTRDGKLPPPTDPEYATSPDNKPWAIYYDLTNQEFVFESQDPNALLLPLAVFFDDSAYDEWRSNRREFSRENANRARAIRSAFMDYQIPVVPLAVEDIGIVTLTFKRVNNGGTPMSDADMARALAWSEGFDLRLHINDVREQLRPSGWGKIDDDPLLKVVAAVCGIEPIEVDPEKLAQKIKAHPEVVNDAGRYVLEAAAILNERIGIVGPGSLPYAQVLIFVARAFLEQKGPLRSDQERELIAWVAEVCLDERFGGAPAHVIRAEWRTFARRVGLPCAEPDGSKRDERKRIIRENWKFGLGWARSLGTGLVLASKSPMFGDGTPIPIPHALVSKGSDAVGMLLAPNADGLPSDVISGVKRLRGVGLRSPANRVICPEDRLPELRRSLLSVAAPAPILDSHLISGDAHSALIAGELDAFFELRRKDIWNAEKHWLNAFSGSGDFQDEPRRYSRG
jgi:hypothetical protein